MAVLFGIMPVVRGAESKDVNFNPTTGNLEYTFGYQTTQAVNIEVRVKAYSAYAGVSASARSRLGGDPGANEVSWERAARELYASEQPEPAEEVQDEPMAAPEIPEGRMAAEPSYAIISKTLALQAAANRALAEEGTFVGYLVKDRIIEGVQDLPVWLPEDGGYETPRGLAPYADPNLVSLSAGEAYINESGVQLRENTLVWNGSLEMDGKTVPVIGPELGEDQFILEFVIEPLGRPDLNEDCEDEYEDDNLVGHTDGKNYTWTHREEFKVYSMILVDYRHFLETGEGTAPSFIMLPGGISERVLGEIRELFFDGSWNCEVAAQYGDLVQDTNVGDPVDAVTGVYHSTYTDLRIEGTIPLTFQRSYNSRYEGGSLGRGFTHGYELSLRDDAGKLRVAMPGGEEQIFLRLAGGGYKALQASEYTLRGSGGGYIMEHQRGS
jgi:hypothetical protein